jgi:hypothetical protein
MFAALGFGWLIGQHITSSAQQNQECIKPAQQLDSWRGLTVSGVPSALQLSFGYGRGTQAIESAVTVSGRPGVNLPKSITVFPEPLVSSDGSSILPPIPNVGDPVTGRGISAVATEVSSSSTYRLEVCIKAPGAAPGSYSTQLMFPGATLPAENGVPVTVPVTVTFQSESVPYVLAMGIVPFSLVGMIYCTLVLIRRKEPEIEMGQLFRSLYAELWSINGVIAFILSVGAVFAAWNAQCYRNPTWGSPWPVVLVVFITMAGAAAGASTIPMGLSKDK